ncbi:Hypothetical protein DB32_000672 [Sandaracinus amylolyticus]|uniref:DUF403 domain-containing protein n=1 Tax=Sandaracinus amylolyticus TaxID=927083 RepID=A0A0F6VZE6_9BACT|nr:Hypothetical protein DB32_000672 [Sandaracinus amylolyticus]
MRAISKLPRRALVLYARVVSLSPSEPPLLSRVADAVHWMNRYVERAENVARFVDVNLHLTLDAPTDHGASPWASLVATTGDHALFKEKYGAPTRENVMEFLTFDRSYPNSIASCLRAARENARSVREVISSEMWKQLNEMYLSVKEASRDPVAAFASPGELYDRIKHDCHAFVGVTYLTMTHNEAWHFGRLGRLLERADKTSRIVDVKAFLLLSQRSALAGAIDEIQWAALLKSASALEMYRKRHGRIVPERVVEFLLFENKFPRSVRYCVTKAERSLHAITGNSLEGRTLPPEALVATLRTELEQGDASKVLGDGGAELHAWIDALQTKLNGVGQAIYEEFLAPRPVSTRAESQLPPARVQTQTQSVAMPMAQSQSQRQSQG